MGFAGAFVKAEPGLVTINTHTHTHMAQVKVHLCFTVLKDLPCGFFAPVLEAHIACCLFALP